MTSVNNLAKFEIKKLGTIFKRVRDCLLHCHGAAAFHGLGERWLAQLGATTRKDRFKFCIQPLSPYTRTNSVMRGFCRPKQSYSSRRASQVLRCLAPAIE